MNEKEIQMEYKEMVGIDYMYEQWLAERQARGSEFLRGWLTRRIKDE